MRMERELEEVSDEVDEITKERDEFQSQLRSSAVPGAEGDTEALGSSSSESVAMAQMASELQTEVSGLPCDRRREGRAIPCNRKAIPCNIRRKGV